MYENVRKLLLFLHLSEFKIGEWFELDFIFWYTTADASFLSLVVF